MNLLSALVTLCLAASVTALPVPSAQAAEPETQDASASARLGAPTPVHRWWHEGEKDWMSVPRHGQQPADSTLEESGYRKQPEVSFYVNMIGTTDPEMVAVYRWWHEDDGDWVDIRDGSATDATLIGQGYEDKTFQYYAYRSAGDGRVAVVRWWHPIDRDWVTMREDEVPYKTMISWGYTNRTSLVWAYPSGSPSGESGYFPLSAPQSNVVAPADPGSAEFIGYPHTMSVLEVNRAGDRDINGGYRYIGHYGHHACGGIRIARTNDLDSGGWDTSAPPPTFDSGMPCRWASTLVDGQRLALVATQEWDISISAQTSTDGLSGTSFGPSTILVHEPDKANGNPTLFRDPVTNRIHLYWYRKNTDTTPLTWEIRVKSSDTFEGLLGAGPQDIGQLVASSPARFAAPQVMRVDDLYYLAVETRETEPSGVEAWRTRVLTGASPQGPFYEIPAGATSYPSGAACVFQHVEGDTLHSYYCQQEVPDVDETWTLNHVRGNLSRRN